MTKIVLELEAKDSKPDTVLAAVQRAWTAFCQNKLTCDADTLGRFTTYKLEDGAGNPVRITTEEKV